MDKLNRYQVSTIFKARTRMLNVKNNFTGKYNDNICRGCGITEETQEHVLKSAQEYTTTKKVRYNYKKYLMKIQNNLGKAEKIDHIMARLTKSGVVPKKVMQPGDLGSHLT